MSIFGKSKLAKENEELKEYIAKLSKDVMALQEPKRKHEVKRRPDQFNVDEFTPENRVGQFNYNNVDVIIGRPYDWEHNNEQITAYPLLLRFRGKVYKGNYYSEFDTRSKDHNFGWWCLLKTEGSMKGMDNWPAFYGRVSDILRFILEPHKEGVTLEMVKSGKVKCKDFYGDGVYEGLNSAFKDFKPVYRKGVDPYAEYFNKDESLPFT